MKPTKKVFAFIDSQNLNLGIISLGWNLDFARFRTYLSDKYRVENAYLFIGYIPDNRPLYSYLQKSGYILIYEPTLEGKKKGISKIKGNVDAELVLHCMIQYDNYDSAVIVSGDGDFYCLIEYLEKNKKLSKIIVPNTRYSSLLRKFSSFIVSVEQFKHKVKKP